MVHSGWMPSSDPIYPWLYENQSLAAPDAWIFKSGYVLLDINLAFISSAGLDFLFRIEVGTSEKQIEKASHLYWPGGNSGVTLGAGYDMGEKQSDTIEKDLTLIGLSAKIAETASGGAGLFDDETQAFCKKHHSLITLTTDQMFQLMALSVPEKESIIRRHINIKLMQYQFDALVSFFYNPGHEKKRPPFVTNISQLINKRLFSAAMDEMRRRIPVAGSDTYDALVDRRQRETHLFMTGLYR